MATDDAHIQREERIRQEILGAVGRTIPNTPAPSVTSTDEPVPIACLNCGGGTMARPEATEYMCSSCGRTYTSESVRTVDPRVTSAMRTSRGMVVLFGVEAPHAVHVVGRPR
jgi:hypothetical protein